MKKELTARTKNSIMRIIGSIILCIVLFCSLFMIGPIVGSEEPWTTDSGYFLGSAMLLFGVFEMIYFGYRFLNEKNKLDYEYIAYGIVSILAGILALVYTRTVELFPIAGTIYILIPIAKRVMFLVKSHKVRDIVLSIIIFIILTALFFGTAICINQTTFYSYLIASLAPGIVITVTSLFMVCRLALSHFNVKALAKIIRKTYAGEVIFGLILLMVAFALILTMAENDIHNFWDALWYCYMLVTTIGLGDFTSVSLLGRILSVLLGIYGIVVVAIVTSIIVNFYNEVRSRDDEKDEPIVTEDNTLDELEETQEEDAEESGEEPAPEEKETKEE